ncbi:MAG: endopeptidase La [Candidatus Cloacimonetes bacterium]|nr:endopeptidase La [Candidatus Cloacimonadota bacterium]
MTEKELSKGESVDSGLVVAKEVFPKELTIIPLIQRPVFPGLLIPFTFSGDFYLQLIEDAENTDEKLLGAVFLRKTAEGDLDDTDLYDVGTVLKIYKVIPIDENSVQIIAQGMKRFRKVKQTADDPYLVWRVDYIEEVEPVVTPEIKAYLLEIMNGIKALLNVNPIVQQQIKMLFTQTSYEKPSMFLDMVSNILQSETYEMQELLESIDIIERAKKLLILIRKEIEVGKIQQEIEKQIEEKMSKQQREFFLREQLKVIKKELGMEVDESQVEIEKLEARIKKLKLSEEVKTVISQEMEKLRIMQPGGPEYTVTQNYLNQLTELPWGIYTKDNLDISRARKILDEDHFGLQDVKKIILEYISTIIKSGNLSGTILCFVGPPGVGKTSIGKSISHSLNRKFFRFSLGGMRDEAEIKGHRRTYIGALPGKIIESLKRSGSSNPVIMLDEIDKLGKSFQGDPASALLEVLDPEQNKDFLDHYLDVRYDLSKVLFVTTANQLDTIPTPLLDRMEIVSLPGYVMREKKEIAKRYLIPRHRKEHGLKASEVQITDKGLEKIIEDYSRDAGVRYLEQQIKKIMRQVTLRMAEGKGDSFSITIKNVQEYLGKPLFSEEHLYKRQIPGVVLGLAWTPYGGSTLYVEASSYIRPGGGFKQTGQLGNVMRESTEIAYSYVRSLVCDDPKVCKFYDENLIHLHVPAGATPKDGPSAGSTMALALYSLVHNKPVKKGFAMTGELTLTGKVLPIGGLREKTIAAKRVGIKELIFPKENEGDFNELPDYIKEGIEAHFVDYFKDILKIAFPAD